MSTGRRRSRRARPLRLRDRFFQAKVARAITAPAGIVAGSLASAVLIGSGAPPGLSLLAGLVAWAVPVGRAMGSSPGQAAKPAAVENGVALGGQWGAAMAEADKAAARFQRSIKGSTSGPLRDRLVELEEDIFQSLDTCSELAAWGAEVEAARRELDPAAMESIAKRAGKAADDAARSQRELVAELRAIEVEVRDRLALINGRLDEAVGRSVEIVGRANDARRRAGESVDLDDIASEVADELRSLSEALHEVDEHEHPHRRETIKRTEVKLAPPGTTATG